MTFLSLRLPREQRATSEKHKEFTHATVSYTVHDIYIFTIECATFILWRIVVLWSVKKKTYDTFYVSDRDHYRCFFLFLSE